MDQQDRDLLIRIDERQEIMSADIAEMKKHLSNLPCKVQEVKLRTLKRWSWYAIIASIGATIKSMTG